MLLSGEIEASGWQQHAAVAVTELASAALLRQVAVALHLSRRRASSTATAYLCCATGALLAGWGSVASSAQTLLLLGALSAALTPGGALLSSLLLAAGSADWPPGMLLLMVPLALLSARPPPAPQNSSHSSSSSSSSSSSTASAVQSVAAYCCYCAAGCAALLQLQRVLPPATAAQMGALLRLPGWKASTLRPLLATAEPLDSLAWVGSRLSQQPWHQRPAVMLPAASLQPGLGLHWYLMAQVFPHFRRYFLYILQALPAALMLLLTLRFPGQPRLLLLAGALLRCTLHPRPVPAMAVLCVGLLPLADDHPAAVSGLAWHGLACAAALLLNDSAMQLWLAGAGGNANFLYGMNLLWAGLLVMLLLRILRAAARLDARPGGDGDSSPHRRIASVKLLKD